MSLRQIIKVANYYEIKYNFLKKAKDDRSEPPSNDINSGARNIMNAAREILFDELFQAQELANQKNVDFNFGIFFRGFTYFSAERKNNNWSVTKFNWNAYFLGEDALAGDSLFVKQQLDARYPDAGYAPIKQKIVGSLSRFEKNFKEKMAKELNRLNSNWSEYSDNITDFKINLLENGYEIKSVREENS